MEKGRSYGPFFAERFPEYFKFRIMNIISFTFMVLVSLSKMLNLEEYPGTQLFLFLFFAFPHISALL